MDSIVVIGGGGHAKVVICMLKKSGWTIAGYTDPSDHGAILGAPYLGNDEMLGDLYASGRCRNAVLGIGMVAVNTRRLAIARRIEALGYVFPPLVSPDAVINEDTVIGAGTVVFDGAVINTGVRIGMHSIVNTGAIIEHDCMLGDGVHIAPGAVLCGGVDVGAGTMVGAGAIIIQYQSVGKSSLIGAGAVVISPCRASGVYAGVPAKRIVPS